MFCLMNFSNWISHKCIFSIGLLTILYSIALFRTIYMMLRALYTQLWQKKKCEVEKYFSENPNFTINKAARVLKNSKSLLQRIVKNFLKLHPYRITTHQLLTTKFMEARVKFCKTVTKMVESGEMDKKKLFLRRGLFLVEWIFQ